MKILLLGAAGNLGSAFTQIISGHNDYTLIGWDKAEIDVTDFGLLTKKIAEVQPDVIINAVAYNDVNACETAEAAKESAQRLNVDFIENLAAITLANKITLVHYSSDYVFDGEKADGYAEDDKPQPINFYGQTKLAGEEKLISLTGKGLAWYLIRTSKLFGPSGKSVVSKLNFFELMRQQAASGQPLSAVSDEIGSFTYTRDLAQATLDLIEASSPFGIYHLVNSGQASWYEAADYFFKKLGRTIDLKPVPATAFPRPAKRPRHSLLLNTKRPALRSWQEALADYINQEKLT